MGEPSPAGCAGVGILDVLRVDLCARALLDLVPVADLVRSERVCTRWQAAVLDYVRGCSTLGFKQKLNSSYFYIVNQDDSRRIIINSDQYFLSSMCEIMKKWGPYLKEVTIEHKEQTSLDIIAANCPNLQRIVLHFCELHVHRAPPSINQILNFNHLTQVALIGFFRFSENKPPDFLLTELFQNKHYEMISIHGNIHLTGSFLKSIKPNILKTLSLLRCTSLTISGLLSAAHNLRSLTCLELQENSFSMLKNVGVLLKEMPQLQVLQLTYLWNREPLSEDSIEGFSGLVNLKRLCMRGGDTGVTDGLLEALARGCSELEYLEIHEATNRVTARGVAALCRRSPSAVTRLDLSRFSDIPMNTLQNIFNTIFRDVPPLYQELAALGYIELTPEWIEAAARDPRGWRLVMNPGPGGNAPRNGDPRPGGSAPRDGEPRPKNSALRYGHLDKALKLSIW